MVIELFDSENKPEKSSNPPELPNAIKKALMQSGMKEEDILPFLLWAFDGNLPITFREACIIWNAKFGDKLWLNITRINSLEEGYDFFSKMGKAFLECKKAHE